MTPSFSIILVLISLLEQNKIVTKQMEVCSIFNDYFINIANDLREPNEVVGKSVKSVIDFYKSHPSIVNIKAESKNKFQFSKVTSDTL